MRQAKSPKPLSCPDQNRLFAVKVLQSALREPNARSLDLLDEDDVFAKLVGARRHKRLLALAKDDDDDFFSRRNRDLPVVRRRAKKYLRECEELLTKRLRHRQDHLAANTTTLSRLLKLNRTESRVLEFSIRRSTDDTLSEAMGALEDLRSLSATRALGWILGSHPEHIKRALSHTSRLVQSGLVSRDNFLSSRVRTFSRDIFDDLDLMPGLADSLLARTFDFERVFQPFFRPCANPCLRLSDFDYLGDQLRVLKALLKGAGEHNAARGVQILLYGPPGTGKTQLAHVLAKAVGASLYSVATGDTLGNPYDRDERFRSFRLAQQALRTRRRSMLLFDEIEDVFEPSFSVFRSERRDKGWTNRLLETAPVPSIWITNNARCMDDAYLRRFSLVLEVDRPPRSVRRKISAHYLSEYDVDAGVLDRIAELPSLTPADLERARSGLKVGKELQTDPDTATRAAVTLLSAGPGKPEAALLHVRSQFRLPDFDPALINTDFDLEILLAGLKRSGEGRLCFYGAPGTGKTAFAKYIAEHLNRELTTVSASSWLDPFVGMTEAKIRRSFDLARRDNAVLFVDEADSFLQDRRLAHHSWETTQVNELLKRLEASQGVVIFATNAFDALDPAVMRRLDIKAEFRALNKTQAVEMFNRTLALNANSSASVVPTTATLTRLESLAGLVNGDFAAACRRLQVGGQRCDQEKLVAALADELRVRNQHQQTEIGFAASVG